MRWLIQANPKRYRIYDAIVDGEPLESWSVGRYLEDIAEGDDVMLWISGKDAGVYGFAQVADSVEWLDGEDGSMAHDTYWVNEEDASRGRWIVPLRDGTMSATPLVTRTTLITDPRFASAQIIRQAMAANPFKVNDDEWAAVLDHMGAPPIAPTQGVTRTGSALVRKRGGGGEGPLHAALKQAVKDDPMGTVGEHLSYVDENLVEALGAEVRFITGDRVDLLMKDRDGRYVVIEVEPTIGAQDHIGFHQAGKYRVLVGMDRSVAADDVRAMVVATTIDERLRSRYADQYAIEWREVPDPR